jgi:hypothetical protein
MMSIIALQNLQLWLALYVEKQNKKQMLLRAKSYQLK